MSKTKQIRDKRNNRILANITSSLGSDFQPLPKSNRQFVVLNRIKDAGVQATIWKQAVASGDTTPSYLEKVHTGMDEVHSVGAQVHSKMHTRMAKLKVAKAVIGDWNGVLKWIRGMEDGPEKAEAMRTLMVLTKALREFGEDYDRYNLTDIVNGLWNGIQRIEDSERIENMRIEG